MRFCDMCPTQSVARLAWSAVEDVGDTVIDRLLLLFFFKECSNEDKLPHQFTPCKHGQLCLLERTAMKEVPILESL